MHIISSKHFFLCTPYDYIHIIPGATIAGPRRREGVRIMNSKGFTLIELIMVIVILGILSAIAIPRYVDLTTKAKTAARDGSLGAIRSAIAMDYANRITDNISGFSPTIYGTMFAEGLIPENPMAAAPRNVVTLSPAARTGQGWYYYPGSGTVEADN